jgi:predicted NAD/FAD-binding protein
VRRLVADGGFTVETGAAVTSVRRSPGAVAVTTGDGRTRTFRHAVIAAHADEALAMLADADSAERELLSAFTYTRNRAVLHTDPRLMPKRRRVWSGWNAISFGGGKRGSGDGLFVSYWMNRLQTLPGETDWFVTLNPPFEPTGAAASFDYAHPVFDTAAVAAQRRLWSLQGKRNTWFCGAHFGAGFHEDGIQSGLAVAEDLSGERRPWIVAQESGRIHRLPLARPAFAEAAE